MRFETFSYILVCPIGAHSAVCDCLSSAVKFTGSALYDECTKSKVNSCLITCYACCDILPSRVDVKLYLHTLSSMGKTWPNGQSYDGREHDYVVSELTVGSSYLFDVF